MLNLNPDKAVDALGNDKNLIRANQLVKVSKPLRAKSRMRHIVQGAWMQLDKAKVGPRESSHSKILNAI